jgi:hypothetical protein
MTVPHVGKNFFQEIYKGFEMPLCDQDCGKKCGPHNYYGVPVCCDIGLVVPAAFESEWLFLQENTDLWEPWSSSGLFDHQLREEVQDGQVLLQCKGYQSCQRSFRTLTCRAFPFYPYLTSEGDFPGMGYYPDFRENCWIISNLSVVSAEYKAAFDKSFQRIFEIYPEYRNSFVDYSRYVRQQAAVEGEAIILLDFSNRVNLIDPSTEQSRSVTYQDLEEYGPYTVTRELRFPDEHEGEKDSRK